VVKGLLIAAFIHATYNVLVSNLGVVTAFVPFLSGLPPTLSFIVFVIAYDGFFFALLYAKLSRYKRVFVDVGAADFYREGDQQTETEDESAAEGNGSSFEAWLPAPDEQDSTEETEAWRLDTDDADDEDASRNADDQ
jgi:hypothetical protein